MLKYEQIIQSLKESLFLINNENSKLHAEIKKLQNTNKHNNKYNLQKEDTQEIKQLLSIIKGEVHTLLNTVLGTNLIFQTKTI